MTDLVLPYGTSVLTHLFRPMRGLSAVGIASMLFHQPGTVQRVVNELHHQRERLIEVLPSLMHPGVPVCLVMSVILVDGFTEAQTAVIEMPRAKTREDLADELFAALPGLVDGLFERMRVRLALAGAF